MECAICKNIAKFVCPCEFFLLCSDHLAPHMSQPGRHQGETLNILLSNSVSENLRKEALNRIFVIEDSKRKISSVTKELLKKIEKCSQRAIQELNRLLRHYFTMLNLSMLSETLKVEVEKILTTTLKVNEVNFDLGTIIEECFNQDLVIYSKKDDSMKNEESLTQKNPKIKENQSKEENKSIEEVKCNKEKEQNKEQQTQDKEIGSNTWTIIEKDKFMKSKKISNYQVNFSGSKRDWIQDIKFSLNGNYSFVCKNYVGMFKQKIIVKPKKFGKEIKNILIDYLFTIWKIRSVNGLNLTIQMQQKKHEYTSMTTQSVSLSMENSLYSFSIIPIKLI